MKNIGTERGIARRLNPIRDLLSYPIAFYAVLAVACEGSINAALLLAQAIYWSEVTTAADGTFYKKSKDWEKKLVFRDVSRKQPGRYSTASGSSTRRFAAALRLSTVE
jgi:hypothetical protein